MEKPDVLVLMSTYNGEKYLEAQVQSILNQENVNVTLLIRDDGSKDSTLDILNRLQSTHQNIKVLSEPNKGSAQSFFRLLRISADLNFQYYCLSDQDDIWEPQKLDRAVSFLKNSADTPALYCSNLKVVDSDLNFVRMMNKPGTFPYKDTSLLKNIVTGCTAVMNRKFIELFNSLPIPQKAVMHDWWLYCLACYFGNIIYDQEAFIKYRQHSANVYGARSNSWGSRLKGLNSSIKNSEKEHYRETQAREFINLIGDSLPTKDRETINLIANYRESLINRLKIALNFKQFKKISVRLRIRILLGLV